MKEYNYNRNSSGNRKAGKPVIFNDKIFAKQKDLADHLGLPESKISRCLNEDIAINGHFVDYAF